MTRQTHPAISFLFLTDVIGNQLAYSVVDTFTLILLEIVLILSHSSGLYVDGFSVC